MGHRRLVVAIFVLSGLAGLVYEVVWSRQLVLVFGNTSQAVSAILTGFFGGMAIGNAIGGRLADRVPRSLALYGVLEIAVAGIALATPWLFSVTRELYRSAFVSLAGQPEQLALVRFGVALLALGPATVLLGATLPTLTRHLVRHDAALAASFARLYAANTIGALLGTALAGFFLIEMLGLAGTLAVGAACSAVAGAAALILDLRDRRAARLAASAPPATGRAGSMSAAVGAVRSASPVARMAEAARVSETARATSRAADAARTTASAPDAAVGTTPSAPAPVGHRSSPDIDIPTVKGGRGAPVLLRTAFIYAFVSGLTSLGYQTLWNRLMSSGTGNSTYIFALILTVFLAGLAIGAALFSWMRGAIGDGPRVLPALAAAQALIAIAALAGLSLVIANPPAVDVQLDDVRQMLGRLWLPVVAVVLPPTIVMGFSLPLASVLLGTGTERAGTRTGLLLGMNTLGSIVGTFVLPFFVVPALGSPHTMWLLAAVNVGLGALLLLRWRAVRRRAPGWGLEGPPRRTGAPAAVVLSVAAAIALVVAFVVPGAIRDPGVARIAAAHGVMYGSAEDDIAAVQAGKAGIPQLWVGGTSMTALTIDTRMMPAFSLALRPDSKRALVIAFGMGSAYRSALIAGLETTGVELVPSVPGMMHWFFPDAPSVLADPHGHIVIADGRNFVELTQDRFDIIVVDPPPPVYSSGVSVISSLEFYRAARARLTTGGVMMQWVPYGQDGAEFRAHVRTYAAVFPHVMVVRGPGRYGTFMFGSDDPLSLTADGLAAILARPGILADASSVGDTPTRSIEGWKNLLPSLIWIHDGEADAFAGPGPLITDDKPLPEYFLIRRFTGAPPG